MVAERQAIVREVVDGLHLQFAAQFGEVGRPLAEVAGVQEEHAVGAVDIAYGIHERGTLDHAAVPVVRAAAQGLEMAVGIVGVQDHQPGLLTAGAKGRQGGRQDNQRLFHI